jgi:hypothetical protein
MAENKWINNNGRTRVIGLDMTKNRIFYPMSYDNLGSVSQNVLKFYQ